MGTNSTHVGPVGKGECICLRCRNLSCPGSDTASLCPSDQPTKPTWSNRHHITTTTSHPPPNITIQHHNPVSHPRNPGWWGRRSWRKVSTWGLAIPSPTPNGVHAKWICWIHVRHTNQTQLHFQPVMARLRLLLRSLSRCSETPESLLKRAAPFLSRGIWISLTSRLVSLSRCSCW